MQSFKTVWADGGTALGAWLSLRDPILAEAAAIVGLRLRLHRHAARSGRLRARPSSLLPRWPARRPCRSCGCPGTSRGSSAASSTPGRWASSSRWSTSRRRRSAPSTACRYAPEGTRSFGPLSRRRAAMAAEYFGAAERPVACIPMIETRQAVEAHRRHPCRCRASTRSTSGPADLSITYGLPPAHGQPGDPFDGALATIVAACQRHGVVPGIHAAAALAAQAPRGRVPHDHRRQRVRRHGGAAQGRRRRPSAITKAELVATTQIG